jgi:hypothetical protein
MSSYPMMQYLPPVPAKAAYLDWAHRITEGLYGRTATALKLTPRTRKLGQE